MTYQEALALTTPIVRLSDGHLGRIVAYYDAAQSVAVREAAGQTRLIPVAALEHGLWCAVEIQPDPGKAGANPANSSPS